MACRRSSKRTVQHLVNSNPHSENRYSTKPCQYSVETLFESRNNLSNTARVSISELYQLKPIAFRWTGTSSAHDQLFFGVSWRVRANELGEITRGVEIDWIDVHYHAYPHLLSRHGQKSWSQSVRWSILAATGHPKCAAVLVKNLLHMVGIITNGASIANDNTQLGVMRHDIEMVKVYTLYTQYIKILRKMAAMKTMATVKSYEKRMRRTTASQTSKTGTTRTTCSSPSTTPMTTLTHGTPTIAWCTCIETIFVHS